MSEEAKEKQENTKESTDWFATLLAAGVKAENSEWFMFSVELSEFPGDKIALIRGQEQRAIAILQKVAEKEFSGLEYEIDDHAAIYEHKLLIDSSNKMRESEFPFMYYDPSGKVFIYNDATLQKYAREALNDLVFNSDP